MILLKVKNIFLIFIIIVRSKDDKRRIMQLLQFAEPIEKSRVIYLEKIKEKEPKESEIITIKNSIDKNFKELLTLSDYKKELINE